MRSRPSLTSDERAIEGLPIRLVIALVVGVASLAIMMQMLGGIGPVGEQEVDVELTQELASIGTVGSSSSVSIDITAVTKDGSEEVEDVNILIKSGTAELIGGPIQASGVSGGSTGSVTIEPGDGSTDSSTGNALIDWRSNQDQGTLQIEVIPPSDSDFKDEESNTEIVVTK